LNMYTFKTVVSYKYLFTPKRIEICEED